MAERVADAMVRNSELAPEAIAELRGPMASYRALFPDGFAKFEVQLAALASESVRSLLENDSADVRPLVAPLAGFKETFPSHYDALAVAIGGETGAALVQAVTKAPAKMSAAVALMGYYKALFPEQADAVRGQVGDILAEHLLARAADQGLSEGDALEAALVALHADFVSAAQGITPQLVAVLIEDLVRTAKGSVSAAEVESLVAPVAVFRRLLPNADGLMTSRVVAAFLDGVAGEIRVAPERISTMGKPLAELARLFPEATDVAAARLAPVATEALAGVVELKPIPQVVTLAGELGELFPQVRETAMARLVPVMSGRLVQHARAGEIDEVVAGAAAMGRVSSDTAQQLEQRLVPVIVGVLASRVSTNGVIPMREDLEKVWRLFPSSMKPLERKLVPLFIEAMINTARQDDIDFERLGRSLAIFKMLFPASADAMEQRVAQALGTAVTGRSEVANIASLDAYLMAFTMLFPARREALEASLAASLTAALREQVTEVPAQLRALANPINQYRQLLPGQTDMLERVVGNAVIDSIESATRNTPTDLALADARVTVLGELLPGRLSEARERIAPLVAESVVLAAEDLGVDATGAGRLVDDFARVFEQYAVTLRSEVAQTIWRAIEEEVERQPGQLESVAPLLADYAQVFPADYTALSGALAARTARVIQRNTRDTSVPLVRVARSLEAFGALFPQKYSALAEDVGSALSGRLGGANVATAQNIRDLASALAQVKSMFPERFAELERKLGDNIAKEVSELIAGAPFKADALRLAGLAAFPTNAALRAIDFELPLLEVQEGYRALAGNMLTKARQLLDMAVKKNATHSILPAYKQALVAQERKALDAYQLYRKVVRTNPRKQAWQKALSAARALWRDNPTFVDVKPPAPNACIASKAGLGQRTSCHDKVGRRRRDIGPVMVVVPVGSGVATPFAISKYEISVADFNRYCSASKACKGRRGKRTLPVTQVSHADIQHYAAWLSKLTGATYRLPTAAEWVYAATANGQQPKRDFNCTVVIGTQQLKGFSLIGYKSGMPNGWGLVNYLGNVQELVTGQGGGLAARGGTYEDKLTQCTIDLSRPHNGKPDAVTGFRLVRLLSEAVAQ